MARFKLEDLIARRGEAVADAFLAAAADIRDRALIGQIEEALSRGDFDGALRSVGIDPAAYAPFEGALMTTYRDGGTAVSGALPTLRDAAGAALIVRFNARNLRAEAWLRDYSSQKIVEIVDDQRLAVREALRAGMERGDNPRTVALDVVGRIDRTTRVRSGGIVGLTRRQAQSVALAREELASGDPARLRNYLGRKMRDRRFDPAVERAIAAGAALAPEWISRAATQYSNRLLKLRGDTIGRTEAMAALHAAQREAYNQAFETGTISRDQVRRVWKTASDPKVRDSHRSIHNEERGIDERFSNGLLHPGEPGAPPEEIINCRCWLDYRIDFLAGIE
jgi:hypothetical protein